MAAEFSIAYIGIVMTTGVCDFIHCVEQRSDQNRTFSGIDLITFVFAFYILSDKPDFTAIRGRKERIGKIFRHIILFVRLHGVIDQVNYLFFIVFL